MTDLENRPPISEFQTTEMSLITFLRYSGYTVVTINKLSEYKAEFVFKNVKRDILEMFNTDKAMVEPKMFASIMKNQTAAAKRVIKQ